MIRIQLVHEGRVVKQITSRVHESVILEQIKRYKDPFDEIHVVNGQLSEGAKDMLRHVAKKIVPAAMAAGLAMGAHANGSNPHYPGLNRSVGQHISDIVSPNYNEIQRQRDYEKQTQRHEWNAHQGEIRAARIEQARQAGKHAAGNNSGMKIYDQARRSTDGKYFLLYDLDHRITRIPINGTEFMQADSQRMPHYIAPNGSVFYVRHPAAMSESVKEGLGPTPTIPASGVGGNRSSGTMSGFGGMRDDDETANIDGTTDIEINNGQLSIAGAPGIEPDDIEEATMSIPTELQAIFDKFPAAWEEFKGGGDLDNDIDFIEAIFDYYLDSGEMPYSVIKGHHDQDPVEWLSSKLDDLTGLGAEVVEDKVQNDDDLDATAADQASADKNIIMQIRKASDYEKPTKLSLADGSSAVVNSNIAKMILDQFEVLKPETKNQMVDIMRTADGFKEVVNFLSNKQVQETAEVDLISSKMTAFNEAEVRTKKIMQAAWKIK